MKSSGESRGQLFSSFQLPSSHLLRAGLVLVIPRIEASSRQPAPGHDDDATFKIDVGQVHFRHCFPPIKFLVTTIRSRQPVQKPATDIS